jgi:alanine racemase
MSNTWIEIDLEILGENVRSLKQTLTPGAEIIFVLKSNAYGHGMIPVAHRAWECGVEWFAVAHVEEAVALREALPDVEIVVVGAIDPADAATAIEHNLIPLIVDEKHASALASAASKAKSRLRCHAKIDTGMGRLGFSWKEAGKILPALARKKSLNICGICSHFSCVGTASRPGREFARIQADRFHKVVSACEKAGMKGLFKHISNSGGILCDAVWNMDGVRPGILLYGYAGKRSVISGQEPGTRKLKSQISNLKSAIFPCPFLSWKTRILQIKKVPAGFPVSYDSTHVTRRATNIATIDVGYADGYHRALSNKGIVLAGGKRCPVVGRVTMNLVMIDLGAAPWVRERDEVVLIGSQGKESVWADELGTLAGTISYEILTSIRTNERRIAAGR